VCNPFVRLLRLGFGYNCIGIEVRPCGLGLRQYEVVSDFCHFSQLSNERQYLSVLYYKLRYGVIVSVLLLDFGVPKCVGFGLLCVEQPETPASYFYRE
jgi:hypothetical protein